MSKTDRDVIESTRAGRLAWFRDSLAYCDWRGYAPDHPYRAHAERCLALWRDSSAEHLLELRPFLLHQQSEKP